MHKLSKYLLSMVCVRIVLFVCFFLIAIQNVNQESSKIENEYLVKCINVSQGNFGSLRIDFIILKKDIKVFTAYKNIKGFAYIKEEEYLRLLNESGFSSLKFLKIYCQGVFREISPQSNPGGQSNILLQLSRKSFGQLELKKIQVFDTRKNLSKVKQLEIQFFQQLENIRIGMVKNITELCQHFFSGNTKGLVMAMLLGNKDELDQSFLEDFRTHGVAHIIAISGLHIGILFLVIDKLFRCFVYNQRLRYFAVVVFFFIYNFIIGINISAIRATCMMLVFYNAQVFNFCYRKENALFITGGIYLLVFPEHLFTCGFLLSYGAVCGLFYIYPILTMVSKQFLENKGVNIKAIYILLDLMNVSIAVNCMTLPVLLYFFGGLSLTTILANMFIVPVVMSFYCCSLLVLLIGVFHMKVALFIAGSTQILASYIEGVSRVLSLAPVSYIYVKKPDVLFVIIYYGSMYLSLRYLKDWKGDENECITSKNT